MEKGRMWKISFEEIEKKFGLEEGEIEEVIGVEEDVITFKGQKEESK